MIPSFMITFREGLEAFLIIGIILAYLLQTKRIPAGTGLKKYKEIEMVKYADDSAVDQEEQNTEKEEE